MVGKEPVCVLLYKLRVEVSIFLLFLR